MKCLKCGHVSHDASPKFCSECGHRLTPPESIAPLLAAAGDASTNQPCLSDMEVESVKVPEETSSSHSSLGEPPGHADGDVPKPLEDFSLQSKKKKRKNKKKNSTGASKSASSLVSEPFSLKSISMIDDFGESQNLQEDDNANLPSLSEMAMNSGDEKAADQVPATNNSQESLLPGDHVNESLEDGLIAPPSKKKKSRKKNKNKGTDDLNGAQSLPPIRPSSEGVSVPTNPENMSEMGQHSGTGELVQTSERPLSPSTDPLSEIKENPEKVHISVETQPPASPFDSNTALKSTQEAMDCKPVDKEGKPDSCTKMEIDHGQSPKETTGDKVNHVVEGPAPKGSKESNDTGSDRPKTNHIEKSDQRKQAEKVSSENKDVHEAEGSVPQKSEESSKEASETSEKKSEETGRRPSEESNTKTKQSNLSSRAPPENKASEDPDQSGPDIKGKPNKENENKTKKEQTPNKEKEEEGGKTDKSEDKTKLQQGKDLEMETKKDDTDKAVSSAKENQEGTTKAKRNDKGKGSKNKENDKPVDSDENKSDPLDNENQSKKQKKSVREAENNTQHERCTRASDPADLVTVYFHVIVSKDFNVNPAEDKVVVMAEGISGYENWKDVVCEMHFTRALEPHGPLYEGHVTIHKGNIQKNIPYKYVVMHKGKKKEYEFIYYADKSEKSHVNRCLFMPLQSGSEREWHQYDDICMKENKSTFRKYFNAMKASFNLSTETYKDIHKAKAIAGEVMLDSIFSILSTCDEINLTSFVTQLYQFYFAYTNSFLYVGSRTQWTSHGFGKSEVNELILKMLNKILTPFLQKEADLKNAVIKDRLAAGMVSLCVAQIYGISFTKDDLTKLSCVLCLEEKPRERLLCQLDNIKVLFSKFPGMHMFLRNLCHACIDRDVDQWIWVLPLEHKFSSLCDQNDPSTATKCSQEDVWAGLEGLEYEKLINRYSKRDLLLQLMIQKKHLLQADRTLIRSWLCVVPVEELNKFFEQIPITVLDGLRACCYKFPTALDSRKLGIEKVEAILKSLLKTIQDLKDKIPGTDALLSCCDAALRLHKIICTAVNFLKQSEVTALSAEIILNTMRFAGQQETSDAQEPEIPEIQATMQHALAITRKWLKDSFPSDFKFFRYGRSLKEELSAWSRFLVAGEHVELKWKESLVSDLCQKIKRSDAIDQISLYCNCQEIFEGLHASVSKCFEDCAIEAVHNACQSQTNILTQLDACNLENFRRLVSAIIVNSWPKDDDGNHVKDFDGIFQHLMEWTDATYIFKLYGTNSMSEVAEDIQELVALSDSVFLDAKDHLMNGDVQLKHLECVIKNEKQFSAICKLKSDKKENISLSGVREVLNWRKSELKSLKHEQECVDILLKMCRTIKEFVPVNLVEIEEKHKEDLRSKKLNQLMSVKTPESPFKPPSLSYYELSTQVMDMAGKLLAFKHSHIFINFWEREAQSFAEEDIEESDDDDVQEETFEALERHVFTPCMEAYEKLYEDIKSGNVTFEDLDRCLKDFQNRYDELKKELATMRCLRISDDGKWIAERVKQIEQYHQLNDAFDSAEVIAKLKGFLNLSGDFQTLETLLQFAGDFGNYRKNPLNDISNEVMKTKKTLAEITRERAECLQEVISRKEFFNWVRDELEDVNELKVFVDLASISAGENDMDVDRVACFHDAVLGYSSLLYEVKPTFGFDQLMHCLKKLWKTLESDKALPKKLRDSARHIEWLKTVKESHGSVELSSLSLATTINKNGIYIIQAPNDNKKVTADSIVRLNLPEDEGVRSYNLEELKELLNKLMLMSGKGEQGKAEVEKFSEVFSNIQRLASSFIDLYLAGNILFRSWKATVTCSDEVIAGVRMSFNVEGIDDLEMLGTLTELLPDICKTMEQLLDEWVHFMNSERSQLYYLNYYSAEQLVYLCQEFQKRDISEEALVMLSSVKPECNKMDLVKALYSPKTSSSKSSTSLGRPDKMAFALELEQCANLMEKLVVVWNFFMNHMSSVFPECLDIDTLGNCLAALADSVKIPVTRELHPSVQQGRPNLILCPTSEILSATIAIYMHSFTQPLPSFDEVLLCTPQTTFEEVALFFKRCLTPGCKGKKIYSLLYADQLSYDTAYKSEQLFQRLAAQGIQDYNLVIICNSDREHCYIPSVFSKYKVHMIPQKPLVDIQGYLKQHFTVESDVISGASCFMSGMSVGIVSSQRAGVGKSLYVKRLHKNLERKYPGKRPILKIIRLINPVVDENKVLQTLLPFLRREHKEQPVIFHIDITSSVNSGIPEFLFKLLVLQYLMDSEGRIWKRQPCQLYIIEILESPNLFSQKQLRSVNLPKQNTFIDFFPKISCRSPKEVLTGITESSKASGDPGMDVEEFRSECFQRPFQYLIRFEQKQNLDAFKYIESSVEGTADRCLQLFLLYCGIMDPSWSELRNFTWFLNLQLKDCESSTFCNPAFVGDTLQGFKNFVVNFMILMAKDFATPSLHIADQSPGRQAFNLSGVREEDLAPFLLRKKWESEPHPYIFFNEDHVSMTFIGFHLRPNSAGGIDAINPKNGSVIQGNIMTPQLYQGLQLQRVPFNVDFDKLPRDDKISRLSMVLGIQWPFDPDETYELTMDNILKILAIKMRFRCGIPVVIMGETGCGKTRLIKFLCLLSKALEDTENMKLVKVHGGTSADTIYKKILEAQDIALYNAENHNCDTVLFFDEANTTDAISSIKEALCDHTVDGNPLQENSRLQIIAACNPYRKHTKDMIDRLESAGLGYRVKADETKERLGSIPLRQLVYRVHALPPSMMPLVWDFGQLNDETEKKYIQQIIQRLSIDFTLSSDDIQLLTNVLSASQAYMRKRNDECSFVSLRDVERCVEVFKWFHNHNEMLLKALKKNDVKMWRHLNKVSWCLVLAVGVCYHASLEDKESYRDDICDLFPQPYKNPENILWEITTIQDLFLSGVHIRDNIARNLALKENLFMMVICIELKIPLFLVGKPGSSKSLAKTIVADAMQGQAAHTDLYKSLKQIHLVSFQCSPHSTPEGIIGTFKHCARFQEGKNLNEYISVVVLDEIGLAEDSPKMPLKTLHPLLEDGCIEDDALPHKKVGFIGISNWALDPAKMNRGIFVSRGDPNEDELIESAKGICSSDKFILNKVSNYFPEFAKGYQTICATQREQNKEFFGLRDFYSLIKMVFAFTKNSGVELRTDEIARAILRNFSGKDEIRPLNVFMTRKEEVYGYGINTMDLVMENLRSDIDKSECRYLLILTKNYAALQLLQQAFSENDQQPEIIFGSSFPKDQEYTQICRNINRVKMCMETGQMVVLLNLQNLYESLYDALNQYYVYLAGQKYVDLGLGTHRVKCRVHSDFRLIVIEEKEVVHKDFPIPLINRLEKHYLDINTVLHRKQKAVVLELEDWIKRFTAFNAEQFGFEQQEYCPSDVFVGYHSDTCASVIVQVTENLEQNRLEHMAEVKDKAKLVLLNCATPDSVIRHSNKELIDEYFKSQNHSSLLDFLSSHVSSRVVRHKSYTEITTFSRLLTSADQKMLEVGLKDQAEHLEVLSLQQFDTEYSFLKKIRVFLEGSRGKQILIIQTDFEESSQGAHLVASAKYSTVNEINKVNLEDVSVFVYFITKLPRMHGGSSYVGFRGGLWRSIHIDDLRKSNDIVSDVTALQNLPISQLFHVKVVFALAEAETTQESEAQFEENRDQDATEMEIQTTDDNEANDTMDIQPSAEIEKEDLEIDVVGELIPEEKPTSSPEDILDTTILIRSCVQNAIGLLRDDENVPSRNTRRVEILIDLLSTKDQIQALFLKMLKVRLYEMLKSQEEVGFAAQEWVVREASNPIALQEAGTFRQTLWKRIQAAVTPILAQLLSIVDCDANMEMLVDPELPDYVKSLWMFIFNSKAFLNISCNRNEMRFQNNTIPVKNYMNISLWNGNVMPFSWRIKDYLEGIWAQAQYIADHQGVERKFLSIYRQTPLGEHVSPLNEDEQHDLFLRYKRDFIILTMNVSSNTELQLMELAFSLCIDEFKQSKDTAEVALPLVHLVYHTFQHRLQTLSRILALNPVILDPLCKKASEPNSMMSKGQMVIDIYAAIASLEVLKDSLMMPNPQSWLCQVKNVQMAIELICSENYLQGQSPACQPGIHDIRCKWNSLYSMALFVEHVLLGNNIQNSEMQELLEVNTLFLGRALERFPDLKTLAAFMAVIDCLQRCREEVGKLTSRFGVPMCAVCREDPKEPVCLKCGHVFCKPCIKRWLDTSKCCPMCKAAVPEDCPIIVSEDLRVAIQRNVEFRQQCNGFFLDIICTLCFKDNTPPASGVIHHLLDLLFTTRGFASGEPGSRNYTKALSPFDDAVDRTPVIRSVILKLLLKYSFDDIIDYAEEYLYRVQNSKILTKEDTIDVYMLFVNCLEDSLHEKGNVTPGPLLLKEEGDFLKHYLGNVNPRGTENPTVQSLQSIARIRLVLDLASKILFEENPQATSREFMHHVMNLCTRSGNDWHRVYFIRTLVNRHGIETIQKVFKDPKFRWIFPPGIFVQQENPNNQIDLFLVCGDRYKRMRDGLGKALLESSEESIVKAQEESRSPDYELSIHMLLAVFREVTMQHAVQNNVPVHDSVRTHIQSATFLQEETTRQFVQSLLNNGRPLLSVGPRMQSVQSTITGLVTHFAAVLLSVQNNLLAPLRNLAFFPNRMQNSYLPTMPEDVFLQFGRFVGENVHWYLCPNGHYCAVGECGRPMQLGKCPDCGVTVGGQNHAPHAGFNRMTHDVDQTQTGHVLGNPHQQEVTVAPEREIATPVFIILRLLTHLAMLLGAEEDQQSLARIVKPQTANLGDFLFQHIVRGLEQLRNTLGKSADETTTVIHLVLCSMVHGFQQPGHWPVRFDETWSNKEGRNNWEQNMSGMVITPALQRLNEDLRKVNATIRSDDRISSNPIVKIVYGDPLSTGDPMTLPRDSRVHCSKLWSCRERISIEYLQHLVQQKNGKEVVPILWKFLEKENELRMVKFLPEILNLQKELIKIFQNSREADKLSIDEFLESRGSGGAQNILKKKIKGFLYVWNGLKHSLHKNGEIKLSEDMRDDLSMRSEISFLLPRRQGKGLCATALVSHLITLHNSIVHTMERFSNEEQTFSVNASDVMDLHVIGYEVERDLIPIILSNCQYNMQSGQGTTQEFDLHKIQRQIASRFLQGKPRIALVGLPTFTLAHDLNYENIFLDVKKRLPQDSLPNSTINSICRDLNAYSDVCEALHIIDVTLGFLATSEGKPEYPLSTYVEKDLQMVEETNAHILEALKRCHLKHVLAVWQLLTALKSEHLLRLKRDPFADVDKAYKQPLTPEGQQKLNAFLEQHGSNLFLLELHEMILLKLKKPRSTEDFKPAWALKDTLGPLLDGKEVDFPELDSDFPEQICLCHCINAWTITAAKTWNRLRK